MSAAVEMRDLVAEAYPNWFKIVSKTYVAIVDHLPWTWGAFVYYGDWGRLPEPVGARARHA